MGLRSRESALKQIDSMLPWVSSVVDHRRRQNMALARGSCATSLFLPHFDVISLRADEIKLWLTPNQSLVIVCTQAMTSSVI